MVHKHCGCDAILQYLPDMKSAFTACEETESFSNIKSLQFSDV